jgi:outer membrane protein W
MGTRRFWLTTMVVFCFCCSGFLSPTSADTGDMQVRVGIVDSLPTDDYTEAGQKTELDSAVGFQASFEYMVTDQIGVEPAIALTNHDVTVKEAGMPDVALGDIDLFALTANVNFHVVQSDSVDLFVGPTVGYAFWGDLKTDLQSFSVDGQFVYGFNVGVDVPFGEGDWAFSAAMNYLSADVSFGGDSPDLGVSPIQLKAGVSYKF